MYYIKIIFKKLAPVLDLSLKINNLINSLGVEFPNIFPGEVFPNAGAPKPPPPPNVAGAPKPVLGLLLKPPKPGAPKL